MVLNSILVPLDGSAVADLAIPHAAALARRAGVGLHLVRVHRPIIPALGPDAATYHPEPTLDQKLMEQSRDWLLQRVHDARRETSLPVSCTFHVGPVVDEIIGAVERHAPALIVCTTHGRGGWMLHGWGTIAQELVRRAECPVLVMTERAATRPPGVQRLMLLLDGTERAAAIIASARWIAHVFDADIELVRVAAPALGSVSLVDAVTAETDAMGIDEYARRAKDEVDRVAAALRSEGLRVTSFLNVRDDVGNAILEHIGVSNPDLVAVATHGRGISRLLTGSVADRIVRNGGRPTLCLRAT
jgi:nucleotide-binding universal stress UspA family protein